ncbi:shikimate kinase [Novosphingobium sp.]|jgi:shikimate kinase|uniref:shikimate kinase n=1 Tax=Novosphingobium sp. TaxID=1874826 RepID=UPI0022BCFE5D|nr:shikimate kinase [Novosphingobium sp.]MCZ8017673.1 shikimate kinase [Novosphingobium sp.]MCZ8033803.1 shikimate kinase [Novosphingobium sp.]MCZ8051159.1 shikimate kinase [Novosphingobium sp.]MCZ8059505.1 shikimate kinase [Novosphingobium sp.]MCZ8231343.1 shikimate kinase [Novosphingobium sp.]
MDHDATELSAAQIAAIANRIDRPVVLVGMMGTGKSSIGKRLAALLNLPFVDADEAIEEAAQLTIAEIFERHGEAHFRDGERRVIARLMDGANPAERRKIIATGGGAFVNPETRALILDQAITVWLDADVDTLVERTGRKDTRPLLRQGDPREILTRLRTERAPAYAEAPIHVMSGRGPASRTVTRVLQEIDKWL